MFANIAYKFRKKRSTITPYVRYLMRKVKETGIIIETAKPKREKPKTLRTPEIIAAVAESVREAQSTSFHRRPQ